MLVPIADGVWIHQSDCMLTNGTIVQGSDGVLLIDPGFSRAEMECLANDLHVLGLPVVAGFATHPHPDHLLWIEEFGDAPRYGTSLAASTIAAFLTEPDWQVQVHESLPPEVADTAPMELLGQITGLPVGATQVPWNGPTVRILEHRAHEAGHAALFVEGARVLAAGDMLSDVLVPFLDLQGGERPVEDYLEALDLLDGVPASVVVPGHGRVGHDLRERVALDRAYVTALAAGEDVVDPRFGPGVDPDWAWVVYVHESQVAAISG